MSQISQHIQNIIENRKGKDGNGGRLKVISGKRERAESLKKDLRAFCDFREETLRQIRDKKGPYYAIAQKDPMFLDRVLACDPAEVNLHLDAYLEEVERLYRRFSRDTINISVIGRAGQGKSTLLKSITGLADEVIPTAPSGDCTGAKSVISNDPKLRGKVLAEISFFTEEELCTAVQKYLDTLGVKMAIRRLSDIEHLDLDYVKNNLSDSRSASSTFLHLKKYVEHFAEYADRIGKTTTEKDPLKIRLYVAQYDVNGNPTYLFLAVKEVHIYTGFEYKDAGNITLVDTIGLGDTALGIKDKMFSTLKEDSDAAIILRRPDEFRDHVSTEDNRMMDEIAAAMEGRGIDKWLFYVINASDALRNRHNADLLEASFKENGTNKQVALLKQIDCNDKAAVEDDLVIPVLNAIEANLEDIDKDLMAILNGHGKALMAAYSTFIGNIRRVITSSYQAVQSKERVFQEKWKMLPLSNALLTLDKYNYAQKKNVPCQEVCKEIDEVIANLYDLVPAQEDILVAVKRGLKADPEIFVDFVRILRNRIYEAFENISVSTLVPLQEKVKGDIISSLFTEGDLGKFDLPETSPSPKWLEDLISVHVDKDMYPNLYKAFRFILDYQLSIEGLIEFNVAKSVDSIDDEGGLIRMSASTAELLSTEDRAEAIWDEICNRVAMLQIELRKWKNDFALIPNHSFYARVHKVREKLILDATGHEELEMFYRDKRELLWYDDFAQVVANENAFGSWKEYADKMGAYNKATEFLINS